MAFREQQVASTEGNNTIFSSCTTQEDICYDSRSKSSQYLYETRIALASERAPLRGIARHSLIRDMQY
jgi:hypothetical protein